MTELLFDKLATDYFNEPKKIGVNTLPSLMPRSHGDDIFKEGEQFSGITQVGNAESCLAIVPSPHMRPTVSRKVFIDRVQGIFPQKGQLPEAANNVPFFSPQVVLWYRDRRVPDQPIDFISLYSLSPSEQMDFCNSLSITTRQAVRFLHSIDDSSTPIVWGIWGNGSESERSKYGQTRGGPTVKRGHIHICNLNFKDQEIVSYTQHDPRKLLNHTAPWVGVFQKEMGKPMCSLIGNLSILVNQKPHVDLIDKLSMINSDITYREKGYRVSYQGPIPLAEFYRVLVQIGGKFEQIYQDVQALYLNFYMQMGNHPTQEQEAEKILQYFEKLGFTQDQSKQARDFVVSIQPTLGQLREMATSADEKNQYALRRKIEKYETFQKMRASGKIRATLLSELIYDATKDPTDKTIDNTWPVHSSFSFEVDDYEERDNGIVMRSFKLYPEVVTTDALPQRKLGSMLVRSLN